MKSRKSRATGGVNLAAEDLRTRPMEYTKDSNVNRAALQRKRGGKTMNKMVEGDMSKADMGRKQRKSGGRLAGDDWRSAEGKGTPAKGRSVDGSLN